MRTYHPDTLVVLGWKRPILSLVGILISAYSPSPSWDMNSKWAIASRTPTGQALSSLLKFTKWLICKAKVRQSKAIHPSPTYTLLLFTYANNDERSPHHLQTLATSYVLPVAHSMFPSNNSTSDTITQFTIQKTWNHCTPVPSLTNHPQCIIQCARIAKRTGDQRFWVERLCQYVTGIALNELFNLPTWSSCTYPTLTHLHAHRTPAQSNPPPLISDTSEGA